MATVPPISSSNYEEPLTFEDESSGSVHEDSNSKTPTSQIQISIDIPQERQDENGRQDH